MGGIGIGVAGGLVGRLVRWMEVGLRKRVGTLDGVRVVVAVSVGVAEMRGVAVGLDEAVLVGSVAVGKGPISASTVLAMAVLVPSALLCLSSPSPDAFLSRKASA